MISVTDIKDKIPTISEISEKIPKKDTKKPKEKTSKGTGKKGKNDGIPQNKRPIIDPNIILAKDLRLGLKEGDNVNVLIMGTAGTGKSFGVIKPNILQLNSSFVVTDPSGEILRALGTVLMENGYDVKVFSTSDMEHSNCYNPFDYVYDEAGEIDETRVLSMVSMFQKNATELKSKGGGDPFWEKSAKALLTACSMYLLEFCDETERNFFNVLKLVQAGKTNEDAGSSSQTALDRLFDKARKINPEAHCFSSYDTFKLAPAKTANSILISAAVDLQLFYQTKVRNMTTTAYKVKKRNKRGEIVEFAQDRKNNFIKTEDNIDLRTVGDKPTAMFVNIPQANGTFNFLVSMMYSQLFDTLYGRAEKICPSKYMINDDKGRAIISMLDSEEDAKRVQEIYSKATVISEEVKDGDTKKTVYYIKGSDIERSDKKFCIPGGKTGYLQKVYSEDVGKDIIERVTKGTIAHGKGRLPWHVQCLLDEFSNIGEIPEFPEKLATMRKYEISCMIVLQSLSQLKNRYDKIYNDILSNCSCTIFLGSSDPDTDKYISEQLGKTTIRVKNTSESRSAKGGNSSTSYNTDARDLMSADEVAKIEKNECIILVNTEYPFLATKYSCAKHPNWEWSGDCHKERNIDLKTFVTCTEKAVGAEDPRDVKEEVQKNIMNGKTPTGKPAYTKGELKSRQETISFFKAKGDKAEDLAKNMRDPIDRGQDRPTSTVNKKGEKKIIPTEEWNLEDTILSVSPEDLGFPTEQNKNKK